MIRYIEAVFSRYHRGRISLEQAADYLGEEDTQHTGNRGVAVQAGNHGMIIYGFDSGPLIGLFHPYYRQRFPPLWEQFDRMVVDTWITSTREVF